MKRNPGTVNTQVNTYSSNTTETARLELGAMWWTDSFAKQTLAQARQVQRPDSKAALLTAATDRPPS